MNRIGCILLMSLATGGAYAQGTSGGVTMSTDPAKAAAVESHAQELKAREAKETTSKPAATHKGNAKTKTSSHAKTTTHSKGKTPATHKSSAAKPAKSTKS
jgi:hypothetical protein